MFTLQRDIMPRTVCAAVAAVWLFFNGYSCVGDAQADSSSGMAVVETGECWMGVYLNGSKVGYGMTSVFEEPGGFRMAEVMEINLTAMGSRQKMSMRTDSLAGADMRLKSFVFSMKSGIAEMGMQGSVAGRSLSVDITSAGRVQKMDIPFSDAPYSSGGVEMYLKKYGLKAGTRFSLPYFDPSTMDLENMEIEVEAKEEMKNGGVLVPVFRVRQTFAGVTARSWINPELGVLKGDGPMGLSFVRETKEKAMGMPSGGLQPDVISIFSIKAEGRRVPEPGCVSHLLAKLSGGDLSGLQIDGGRQEYALGVVKVSREGVDYLPVVKIPVTGAEFAQYLKPEPFVQSADDEVVRKAREVIGGAADALTAAIRLSDWVHKSMKRQSCTGIPSATEVLANMTGDCNEHTVLYTALARAAGVPARMAAGIVMMDGRMYYHAWPEVYVGGWVAVDPTFGQFPADATHIRLAEGGPDKTSRIVPLMGKLKVEVLEAR